MGCGARTPLDRGFDAGVASTFGVDAGEADGIDGGVISFGLCSVERAVGRVTGGERNELPTMARGADSIMLAMTREELDGRFIHATTISTRGVPMREARNFVQGHGGTIGALLDGTTFGLLYLDDGSQLTGLEITPELLTTGPPRSFGDSTAQQVPALAIGDAALGFGWTMASGTTSRLFLGDDDSGRMDFNEVIIEGHDPHAVSMRSASGRIRYSVIVGDVAQTRVFSVDGRMVGDISTVGLMGGGQVKLVVGVSNRTDDGVVVAGNDPRGVATIGVLHERRTRRIRAMVESGATPFALDAAADPREGGWMLSAASWAVADGSHPLELYATNGREDVVMPLPVMPSAINPPHPTVLAPSRPDEPFLVAFENDYAIEIARVFCAR